MFKTTSKTVIIYCIFLSIPFIGKASEIPFATGEWAPFTGKKLPEYGMITEIVSAACSAANLTPQYHFYPWKRAELNVVEGNVFATFPYRKTSKREKLFRA